MTGREDEGSPLYSNNPIVHHFSGENGKNVKIKGFVYYSTENFNLLGMNLDDFDLRIKCCQKTGTEVTFEIYLH